MCKLFVIFNLNPWLSLEAERAQNARIRRRLKIPTPQALRHFSWS